MSSGDSSLRTGSVWPDFVTSENALCCNSRDQETVQNMSPGDSSLRTGSIWLAFVTSKNALDSKKCFITHIVSWVTIYNYFPGQQSKLSPHAAVDHLISYRPRPRTIVHQVVHSTRG